MRPSCLGVAALGYLAFACSDTSATQPGGAAASGGQGNLAGQASGGVSSAGIAGAFGGGGGGVGGAGGSGAGSAGMAGGGSPPVPAGPVVRILQLNVWQEGTSVEGGLAKIAAVILEANADVTAFSEVRNYDDQDFTDKVLAELKSQAPEREFFGQFVAGDVGLVSRFPIDAVHDVFDETDVDAGSIMAWTLAVPGAGPLAVASAHLDYQHYALNWIRGYEGGSGAGWNERPNDGELVHETDPDVLLDYNNQSRRDEAVAAFIAFAESRPAGTTVVLSGDFNEGSDLDWTERAKDAFGHYGAVVPWDNSLLLASAGFVDAYRAVHPHELDFPGFTWPSPAFGKTTTTWAPRADERDRIDFIYVPSDRASKDAWIVGPNATHVADEKVPNPGQDAFLASALPWPSDHKGVLIALELSAAP